MYSEMFGTSHSISFLNEAQLLGTGTGLLMEAVQAGQAGQAVQAKQAGQAGQVGQAGQATARHAGFRQQLVDSRWTVGGQSVDGR